MLRLSPQCPENVTYIKYRHLTFLGNHFALSYTCSVAGEDEDKMMLSLSRIEPNAPSLSLVVGRGGKAEQRLPLGAGQVLTLPRQEAFLRNAGTCRVGKEESKRNK